MNISAKVTDADTTDERVLDIRFDGHSLMDSRIICAPSPGTPCFATATSPNGDIIGKNVATADTGPASMRI